MQERNKSKEYVVLYHFSFESSIKLSFQVQKIKIKK